MVFLNGKFLPIEQAMVPVLDRGFIFGDGVYEVVPVYDSAPFGFAEHMARLDRSLAELRIANPLVNPPRELVEKGGSAVSAVDNRWLRCDIKSISLLGNVLARQVSADAGAQETILFRDGKLTEASASNVFIVKGGELLSPPKTNLILPGITYDVVTEIAQAAKIPLVFRDVSEAEVRSADEVWVTSSSKEILAIVTLDGKQVGDGRPGPLFKRAFQLYQQFKARVMRKEAVSA